MLNLDTAQTLLLPGKKTGRIVRIMVFFHFSKKFNVAHTACVFREQTHP